MTKDLVEAIKVDHKKLKKLYKEGLKDDVSLEEKKYIFERLAPLVTAHAKSEEAVLYANTCNREEFRSEAFEGFEEHGLVELLIEEMKSEDNEDRWSAKFTVVCELLDHHINEEEDEYLPRMIAVYSDKQRLEMGKEYNEMFSRLIDAQKSISEPKDQEHLRSH